MEMPVELIVALVVVLLLGGATATGHLDPISQIVFRIFEQLKQRWGTEDTSQPVSITNENVEKSDTNVEIHYHFYEEKNPKPPISDGGRNRDDD